MFNTSKVVNKYYTRRPAWTLANAPLFKMRDIETYEVADSRKSSTVMSIPSYNSLMTPRSNLNSTKYRKLLVRLKEPQNQEHIQQFMRTLYSRVSSYYLRRAEVMNYYGDIESLQQVQNLLDVIFAGVLAATMFLCYFSINSSISRALKNDTQMIANLLSVGMTRFQIKRLYFYETVILLSSSCFQGIVVGTTLSLTLAMQQSKFQGLPKVYHYPLKETTAVIASSFLLAFFSTWLPTSKLMKLQISEI